MYAMRGDADAISNTLRTPSAVSTIGRTSTEPGSSPAVRSASSSASQ